MHRLRGAAGRAAWPLLLLALAVWVTRDFVRYPFVGARDEPAAPARIAVWAGASVGGGSVEQALAQRVARTLARRGAPAHVVATERGSAETVRRFLAGSGTPARRVLVVTSALATDLARDRRDRLVPGAALEAATAARRLRDARPIADLGGDPLAFGALRGGTPSARALLAAMRRDPGRQLVAIPDDTWTKAQLAALVDAARVHGDVPYSVFRTSHEAVAALRRGEATAVLASRSALAREARRGGVAVLGWPAGAGPAPRRWAVLVAPAAAPADAVAALRRAVAPLAAGPGAGGGAGDDGASLPARFGGARLAQADRLVRIAARVGER